MKTNAGTIKELISRRAATAPQGLALLAPGRKALDNQGLLEQVEETAARLRALEIGPQDRVAIVLPNGPEMAAAFLAVASCAASAPLNPAYSASEFDFYLADLEARALIVLEGTETPARGVAAAKGIPILELRATKEEAAGRFRLETKEEEKGEPYLAAKEASSPGDVALVLHTSGTTSRPKIVPLTQANLCASAEAIRQTLCLQPADRCLNIMPLFHIHGLIGALLSSMAAGGNVVCTPGLNAEHFFGWLDEFQPSWYSAVPTMHQAILGKAASYPEAVARAHLRLVRSSSASLPPQVMAELEKVFRAPVIEAYGMTEASHQMASNPLPPLARKPGSVGLAAGPEVTIMDEAGNLLPHGQTGEIVIRGANVTAGYANNPKANAGAFTNGWFRTGDQGYLDADGYLFITGRLKELINRGGEKIAPRELDEAFMNHPAVAQAVAFAIPHATLGEDAAVAVVLKPDAEASPRSLRAFAFERLAAHKVPSQVVIVKEIPKGPTGKLQRIGLADKLAEQLKTVYTVPRDGLEATLAQLWEQVLGLERVGAMDNFFALGGDSLQATQLAARIGAAFEVDFPIRTVFREPVLAHQAEYLEELLIQSLTS